MYPSCSLLCIAVWEIGQCFIWVVHQRTHHEIQKWDLNPIERKSRFVSSGFQNKLNKTMCLCVCVGTPYAHTSGGWGGLVSKSWHLSHAVIWIVKTNPCKRTIWQQSRRCDQSPGAERTEEQDVSWLPPPLSTQPLRIPLRRVLGGPVAQGHLFNWHVGPITHAGKI